MGPNEKTHHGKKELSGGAGSELMPAMFGRSKFFQNPSSHMSHCPAMPSSLSNPTPATQDDYGAEARGFVENSYLAGLTPQEVRRWRGEGL